MPIRFDRNICCDLDEIISREWLVSNGIGGYAAGTVAGVLTRMHHGLLVASPLETAVPQLLLAKIDEEVVFDQRTYYLGTNEYQNGTLDPAGFVHLETFCLEEGFPVFTYHLGGVDGIVLEKRIWMPHGYNTTYIQYRVVSTTDSHRPAYGREDSGSSGWHNHTRYQGYSEAAQRTLTLTLLPLSAYRPYHQPQYGNHDWHFQVERHQTVLDVAGEELQGTLPLPKGVAGCTIRAWEGAHPYHILAIGHPESQTTFIPTGVWYWQFLLRHEQAAELPPIDDLYLPGVIRAKLWPGEDATLTIIATAEELAEQTLSSSQVQLSYKRRVEQQRSILQTQRYFGEGGETTQPFPVLSFPTTSDFPVEGEEYLRLLLQGAERFVVRRTVAQDVTPDLKPAESIPLVLASYYGMEERTRDTLIALPGLALAVGRYDEARRLLRGIARYFKQGMLPDRFPQPSQAGLSAHVLTEDNYGSVDTTLWYFYALDHYLRITHDYELLAELYQRLAESIDRYMQGSYYGIRVDSNDGLLEARQPEKALTWMNATVKGAPITPRQGKPVEVNALWYHALSLMHEWSQQLYRMGQINYSTYYYQEQSAQCKKHFQQRFWYAAGNYLYDVVDGPGGDDTAMRPNQLLALSLRYPVLDKEHRLAVLEQVTQHLVTPYGLRTLAPHEAGYQGQLKGNQEALQRALHQGGVWPWLIGPYIDAWRSVDGKPAETGNKDRRQKSLQRMQQKGIDLLEPFRRLLSQDMLGMIGGVFAGDAPHDVGYDVASALSVGEILRVYTLFTQANTESTSLRHPVSASTL